MSEHENAAAEEPIRQAASVVAVEEEEQDGVDLRDVVGTLAAGKWTIGIVTLVFTALAVVYLLLWPSTYSADALIQVNQFTPGGSSLAAQGSLVAPLFPGNTIAAAEVEIMTSRAVLLPVVRKMHLNILIDKPIPVIGKIVKPHTPPITIDKFDVPDAWKDTNLSLRADGNGKYTLFSPDGRPAVTGQVGQEAVADHGRIRVLISDLEAKPGHRYRIMRLFDSEAVDKLQTNLTATQLGSSGGGFASQSGVVQLELEGHNRYGIVKTVNAIADQYIRENIAAMAEQAKKSLEFVNAQLPSVTQKLNTAQVQLAKYESAHGVVDLDAQTQATLQQIAVYEGQLTQLELSRVSLSQQFTSSFPGYAALVGQERAIKQKIDALNSTLKDIPQQELQYVELKRDTTVYSQLYQQLLATQQDLEISQAGTVGTARIVNHALTPYEPEWPIPALVVAAGIGLGLIFGVIVVLLKSALSRGVLDATELERTFGLPVFAIIPHSRRQDRILKEAKKRRKRARAIPLLALDDPQDPAIEALRSLRTSIKFALWDKKRPVITFGGASPGVGKSFLSVNVAHLLGAANERVLVIDADMRKGQLHRYFRVRQSPGLSEMLTGQKALEEVIHKDPLGDGVDFVSAGRYPPSAFDLVSNPRFEALIERVGGEYDVVIIDVPPVLAVAEGLVISRLATANFLVVRAGMQTDREIHLALERMRQNGIRLMGFVFNNLTQRAATATFGRYAAGEYAYHYRYSKDDKAEEHV